MVLMCSRLSAFDSLSNGNALILFPTWYIFVMCTIVYWFGQAARTGRDTQWRIPDRGHFPSWKILGIEKLVIFTKCLNCKQKTKKMVKNFRIFAPKMVFRICPWLCWVLIREFCLNIIFGILGMKLNSSPLPYPSVLHPQCTNGICVFAFDC